MIGVFQIKGIRQIGKIMVETWVALRPRHRNFIISTALNASLRGETLS